MATDSHSRYCKGSKRDHIRKKADANTNGIRQKLIDAEYDKELAEIREQFNELKMRIEESQRVHWLMKKRVKW